jgi:hypothetical protein
VKARHRIAAAILACGLHAALLVPTIGSWSSILVNDFAPQAEAIESGELPYDDQEVEYPPLSIPVLQGPALLGEGEEDYISDFQWEMLAFDLAIVALLAIALPGCPPRVIGALGVYTAGIVIFSGTVLDDSLIDEAPLALARFDLVPALLVLAAVLARGAGWAATWSALLSAGVMVKAFPLALYPALLRGERRLRRVALGGLGPLALAVVIVLAFGDGFSSAITYHTNRDLQVETIAATPFELAKLTGAPVSSVTGQGGQNIDAGGTELARWASILIGIAIYMIVLRAGWRAPVSHLRLATALLAVIVVFAPVLSPQFLLWLLPLSAAAYGFGRENLVLLVAILLTQLALQYYDQAFEPLGDGFIWRITARNLWLLVYLWVVCAPIVRAARGVEAPVARRRPKAGARLRPRPSGGSRPS